MNSIEELYSLGQSIWLDNISRAMIENGRLKKRIDEGLSGMTSNPTIFDKSISTGIEYDDAITQLHDLGKSTFEIYDDLTIRDVQDAADLFLPVYKKRNGLDGYVSLEVNPKLAHKTEETVKEAARLHKKLNRPNLMLKIPATDESFEAIETLIAQGININVTLIFSLGQYKKAANAYLKGIRKRIGNNLGVDKIRSVASVFVSRIDSVVDKRLDENSKVLFSLKGKAAVANSAVIYAKYREMFNSAEFQELKLKGANVQRVLWGSTSTKTPSYSDIKYIKELIGVHTVNTVPEETLDAFLDHGKAEVSLGDDVFEFKNILESLKNIGIDIDLVCAQLLKDGVSAFEKSFDSLLNAIEQKRNSLCKK